MHKIVSLIALLLAAGCAPYGGSSGGGGGGGGAGCGTCDADEFCYDGDCELAFDRRYQVTILGASAETTNPVGDDWDVGGGAPDLFVDFGIANAAGDTWIDNCATSTADDDFFPAWNEGCEFVFESGATFMIDVWDEDLASDDFVGGVFWQGNDAVLAVIDGWGIEMESEIGGGALTVRWRLDPTF